MMIICSLEVIARCLGSERGTDIVDGVYLECTGRFFKQRVKRPNDFFQLLKWIATDEQDSHLLDVLARADSVQEFGIERQSSKANDYSNGLNLWEKSQSRVYSAIAVLRPGARSKSMKAFVIVGSMYCRFFPDRCS